MKFVFLVVLFVSVCALFVRGFPTPEDIPEPVRSSRQRRVTCELLSMSTPMGSLNHSACAAHCLAMLRGYRGGYCNKGVCQCRT